jgi:protein-tyrosine phosphatase
MNFTWIDDGLLSASDCPVGLFDLQELAKKGVRAIVTLTEKPLSEQTNLSEEHIKALGLGILHAPIIDFHAPNESLVRHVAKYIDVMQQDGAVHIHCLAGQERTGTILHAYYMLKGQTIEEANAHIALVRPQSAFERLKKPQQDFLRELEKKLRENS